MVIHSILNQSIVPLANAVRQSAQHISVTVLSNARALFRLLLLLGKWLGYYSLSRLRGLSEHLFVLLS